MMMWNVFEVDCFSSCLASSLTTKTWRLACLNEGGGGKVCTTLDMVLICKGGEVAHQS
jgi:hypothetical protein